MGVGFWRSLLTGRPDAAMTLALEGPVMDSPSTDLERSPRFGVDIDSGVLYGTPTLDDAIYQRAAISREDALRVPAVRRARDIICGEIGQFPLVMYDPAGAPVEWNLLAQPEAGIARTVTMTRTVEDLLLYEHAWWKTTAKGWHGRPDKVNRLDPATVTVQPRYVYYPEGSALVWPDRPNLTRFDSPNQGLLTAGSAIRSCVLLEVAALQSAQGLPPMDWFTPADGVDPAEDDDILDILDEWAAARAARRTAYVPAALKYNRDGFDPEKLQLMESRNFAITEVARLTGIDAEELSVSTTSRTYFNGQDRRRNRVESLFGPYMNAIEGRLSMDDITPHGYRTRFDLSNYLRLDDAAAATADATLVGAKIITRDEARAKRGLQPLGGPAALSEGNPDA